MAIQHQLDRQSVVTIMPTATVIKWKLFKLEKQESHVQLSFETTDGLIVKNLYIKHPNRTKTIQFLKSINGQGSFRTLDDLESIIKLANFKPGTIEWCYSKFGEKLFVRAIAPTFR